MDASAKSDRLVRFSVYELDRDSGELFKQGRKVKLQGQPFELLVTLLERPGEVLTREELRQRIWSSETAGDFDQGLNRAVNKIREALGDSAENPRFIETLPRRGYRFIGSMASPPPAVVESSPAAIEQSVKSRRHLWIAGGILVSVLLITAGSWMLLHRSTSGPMQLQELTTNSSENPILHAAISPDGKYLAYGDLTGIQIRLISTGESHTLPRPSALSSTDLWVPQAWFPDGTHLLASSEHSTTNEETITAWSVSVVGGSAVPLREGALAQSISPDGSTIAFTTGGPLHDWTNAAATIARAGGDIWLMNSQGTAARKIVTAGAGVGYIGSVRWSPDGKRLAYQELRVAGGNTWNCAIKSVETNGGGTSVAVTYRQDGAWFRWPAEFVWLPDNRIVYAVAENLSSSQDTNLWQIEVDRSGSAKGQPQKTTNLAGFHMSGFSYTTDGKHLLFESTKEQSRIQIGSLDENGKLIDTRLFTLDERNNLPFDWTADSKSVIFSSDRTGKYALYRQALDANVPELIRTGPESIPVARLSPDSAYLVYSALSNVKFPDQSESRRFMRAPVTGGPAVFLFEDKGDLSFDCPKRPGLPCLESKTDEDGKQETFFSFDPVSGSRHQLFRMSRSSSALDINWMMSPSGSDIAMVRYDTHAHVEIRSLQGRIEKEFDVKGWPGVLGVDWAADGKTLVMASPGSVKSPSGPVGVTLLRVDLEGNAQPIWETTSARYSWGIASPDGKHLAIWQPATEGNIWRLDNF